jgi:alkylhydroperoxidase family enzyme
MDQERAALLWAETVTLVAQTHVPDDVYQEVLQCFSAQELIDLTMVVISTNAWNCLAISFRKLPRQRAT